MGAIIVDTSAIIAIAFAEKRGSDCLRGAIDADEILISASTYAEALLVGLRRDASDAVNSVLTTIAPQIVPTDQASCERMIDAYDRWGKGKHRAGLNVFDCFAYALAEERGLPLLFIGRDFSQTDVTSVLANPDPEHL